MLGIPNIRIVSSGGGGMGWYPRGVRKSSEEFLEEMWKSPGYLVYVRTMHTLYTSYVYAYSVWIRGQDRSLKVIYMHESGGEKIRNSSKITDF